MKHIALFGGSFNPPHRAHRQVLEFLLANPDLDQIWVLPSFDHPFEKNLVAFEHRLKMCELLIEGLSPKISVSLAEKEWGQTPSYTIDVVRFLKKKYPDTRFSLVLGSDCRQDLPRWKNYAELQKEAGFIFVPRPGFEESPFDDISSTAVRRMMGEGKPVSLLPAIESYIRQHKLYGSS